eukprot:CAMPEP_0117451556 /NCGR_PEP_ID=MMETSP0759-20121206/9074_1 /TAXON_ID=63605 /ORGANISM="Percolomonas cosmopolitus, Strain WS" /LENGTH=526 /DNA_ID=CAMNT_0005244171 /DNA_START=40 /DNA_END=1617 /DNA_ORIENTATION=+
MTLISIIITLCTFSFFFHISNGMPVQDHNLQRGPILKAHTFQPPYLFGMSSSIPHFEYGGSAVATENFVRLVPAVKSRVGWMWNLDPLEKNNWQVILEFHIHNSHSPGADGLAFWYTKNPKIIGPLYGYIENFNGLGIIFDTYDNNGDGDSPGVIAVMNNGQDVQWDYGNDLKANKLASCQSNFRNPLNSLVRAKITYEHGILAVGMDTLASGEFSPCFSVSVSLPRGYHLGLTAATGGLADYHDVFSLVTSDLDAENGGEPERQHLEHGKKGSYNPYEFYDDSADAANDVKSQANSHTPGYGTPQHENSAAANQGAANTKHEERVDRYQNVRDNVASQQQQENTKSEQQETDDKYKEEEKFFQNLRKKLKKVGLDDLPLRGEPSSKATKKAQSLSLLSDLSKMSETILEGVEEVGKVVQQSSTRDDIQHLIRRITAIAEQQERAQIQMADLRDHVKAEMATVVTSLRRETADLDREIKKLQHLLQGYGGSLNEIQAQTGSVHHTLRESHAQMQYEIRKSSGTSYW